MPNTFDLTHGPRDAVGHGLAVAGAFGGHAIAYVAVRALIGAAEGSQWWRDSWGMGILILLAVAILLNVAAPAVGCWLALRAGRRAAAGLTATLVVPATVVVGFGIGQIVPPFLGAGGPGSFRLVVIVSFVTFTVLPPLLARLTALRIWSSREARRPAWASRYPGYGR